jgi:hypothetical protein
MYENRFGQRISYMKLHEFYISIVVNKNLINYFILRFTLLIFNNQNIFLRLEIRPPVDYLRPLPIANQVPSSASRSTRSSWTRTRPSREPDSNRVLRVLVKSTSSTETLARPDPIWFQAWPAIRIRLIRFRSKTEQLFSSPTFLSLLRRLRR